jgi:hypothetical protein
MLQYHMLNLHLYISVDFLPSKLRVKKHDPYSLLSSMELTTFPKYATIGKFVAPLISPFSPLNNKCGPS